MGINIGNIIEHAGSARAYLWDMRIERLGDKFNARCTTAAQPQPEIADIAVDIRAYTYHEAGAVTWNNLSFTVIETANFDLMKMLYDWANEEWNWMDGKHTPAPATAKDPRSDTKVILNGLENTAKYTWVLHNCVLVGSLSFPEMASSKDGTQEISFEVAYAYATLDASA